MKNPMLAGAVTVLHLSLTGGAALAQCDPLPLTHSSPAVDDWLGIGVAIDGTTLVAGATGDDLAANEAGGARVFEWSPSGGWQMTAALHAPDAWFNDQGGYHVAISGDTIFVDTHLDDDHGNRSGSVNVYERTGSTWAFAQKLTADDADAEDLFGAAIDIDGTRAIIGAQRDEDGGFFAGAAYVFERGPSGWFQTAKLVASDAGTMANFGISVAVDGDVIVVGSLDTDATDEARGTVYVFEHGPSGWEQVARLQPTDLPEHDYFGWHVALSGDRILASSENDSTHGFGSGAVYVFRRDPSGWRQEAKLIASNPETNELFGSAVAIDDPVAVIGTPYADDLLGAVYVFERVGTTWIERQRTTPASAQQGDRVGRSVAVSGTRVVAGSPLASTPVSEQGVVYTFEHSFGASFCAATPNSTGDEARISPLTTVCGSVASNAFRLEAAPVPDEPGLFFYGEATTQTPFANGFLCIARPLHRLPVEQAASGVLAHDVDLTSPPSGAAQITAGSTWHFQAWFRDPTAGGAAANTSNGLTTTFQP